MTVKLSTSNRFEANFTWEKQNAPPPYPPFDAIGRSRPDQPFLWKVNEDVCLSKSCKRKNNNLTVFSYKAEERISLMDKYGVFSFLPPTNKSNANSTLKGLSIFGALYMTSKLDASIDDWPHLNAFFGPETFWWKTDGQKQFGKKELERNGEKCFSFEKIVVHGRSMQIRLLIWS